MICDESKEQLSLTGFETFFERELDKNNRWVKLSCPSVSIYLRHLHCVKLK